MGNAAVKQHYETAPKTGVFKLSDKLKEFPPKLYELKAALRTLDLSENRLIVLPDDIGKFENLKHLRFNRNRLTSLPNSIGSLKKLESLYVADNLLTSVCHGVFNLSHLKQVNLSGNQLSVFPNTFKGLMSLDVLDLSRNKITEVPDYVQEVHALELILNQNQISVVSDEIAKCPRLRTLRLEENCLTLEAVPRALLKDSTVSVLTIEGNMFEMKALANVEEYSFYMDRYTAMKKKIF